MRKSYQNRTKEEFEVSLEKISEELQDKLSEMTKCRIGYSIERLMLSPRDDLNVKDYIEENKKARITHNRLTEENNKINKELERKQSELKKTELRKDNLDKENGQLRNEVSEQKKMLEEMYKEQKQGYEAYTQLEKNISKTQDILSEKRKELNGIEIEVADKKEDLETLVEDLDKYQDIKEKQAEEIAKLTDTYLNIETEKTALEKTIAKNKGDMTYLSEKLMDLNKEKERNKAEIEATKTTYIQLSKDKAVLDCELNEKRKEMIALDGTLKNWSEIKEKHTSTIFGLEQQITGKRLEKENLEQQTQNYVNEIQRLNVEKFSINLDGMELDAIYSAIKPKAEFLMESNPETYMKGNASENKEILEKILMEGAIKAFKNDKTKKYRTDELIAFVSPERRDTITTSVKKRKYSDIVVM
jgi:chromosome segregation ATPase